MKIILSLSLLLAASLNTFASTTPVTTENVCVVQVLKGASIDKTSRFDLACGAQAIAGHQIQSYAGIENKEAFKASLNQAVKNLMGGNVTCTETDTEYVWVSICSR